MEIQRLRSLTTGRLHTDIAHVYQDLEFLTGMTGVMTHMLPNIARAVAPWLKERVTDERFWDGEHDPTHIGKYPIDPMSDKEQKLMLERYTALPHPFAARSKANETSNTTAS